MFGRFCPNCEAKVGTDVQTCPSCVRALPDQVEMGVLIKGIAIVFGVFLLIGVVLYVVMSLAA